MNNILFTLQAIKYDLVMYNIVIKKIKILSINEIIIVYEVFVNFD